MQPSLLQLDARMRYNKATQNAHVTNHLTHTIAQQLLSAQLNKLRHDYASFHTLPPELLYGLPTLQQHQQQPHQPGSHEVGTGVPAAASSVTSAPAMMGGGAASTTTARGRKRGRGSRLVLQDDEDTPTDSEVEERYDGSQATSEAGSTPSSRKRRATTTSRRRRRSAKASAAAAAAAVSSAHNATTMAGGVVDAGGALASTKGSSMWRPEDDAALQGVASSSVYTNPLRFLMPVLVLDCATAAVLLHNGRNWKNVHHQWPLVVSRNGIRPNLTNMTCSFVLQIASSAFKGNKSAVQCLHRWTKVLKVQCK